MSTEKTSPPDPNERSDYWSIFRFKGKTDRGSVYPIRIKWNSHVTRDFVLRHCQKERELGDREFRPFKHFTCHPVKQ
jgi:hypothetical protein